MSTAAVVVAQVRKKTGSVNKVEPILSSRLEYGEHAKTGLPTLTAIFSLNMGREPQHLDLSFLLDFPNLAPLFADAYIQWGATRTPATRLSAISSLIGGFYHYLNSRWRRELQPQDIDDELLIGFRTFLSIRMNVATLSHLKVATHSHFKVATRSHSKVATSIIQAETAIDRVP